jgi:hypothetical protein
MRGFLINKNLSFFYWLKKRIGKRGAFWVANTVEKVILIFGREQVGDKRWWHMNSTGVTRQGKSILLGYYQREGKSQKE